MKSSVEKLGDTRVKLTVTVPFEELGADIDRAYAAIAQQVMIPGFRKGKAPRQLIDARFGRGPILEQVVNDILPRAYEEAVRDNDVNPLSQPDVDVTAVEDGSHVEFTAEVDVRPEITVPDFSSYEITVDALGGGDDAVEAEIGKLRERFAELKDADRPLAEGDTAVVDLSVTVDGEEVADLGGEDIHQKLGEDELIPGLAEALTGMKAGEEKSFATTVTAGERTDAEGEATVTVKQARERVLPELDDEFVQEASPHDTVDELREATRNRVEEEAKGAQAGRIRDEVLKRALEEADFPLPEGVVAEQLEAQRQQLLGQIGNDEALLTRILEAQGTSKEDFDTEQRESAEKAVRTQLFLDALAEQEKPEVSQQELSEHILFTARSYGIDPNSFVQQITQSGQIGSLYADVRRGKALAAAILRATVTDSEGEKVDLDEYFGEDEPEAEETPTDDADDTAADDAAADDTAAADAADEAGESEDK